jgi:hypothetical protein
VCAVWALTCMCSRCVGVLFFGAATPVIHMVVMLLCQRAVQNSERRTAHGTVPKFLHCEPSDLYQLRV